MASVIEALLRLPEDVLLWPLIMFEPRGGLNGITPAAKNTVLGFGAEHNIISNKQLSRLLAFVNIKKKLKFIRTQLDSGDSDLLEKAKTCYDKFIRLSMYLLLYSKEFACKQAADAFDDSSDESTDKESEPKKEGLVAWFFSPITEAAEGIIHQVEDNVTDAAAEACEAGDAPNEDQINAAAKEYYESLIIFIDELQQTYTKFSEIKADAGADASADDGAPRDQLSVELDKSPSAKINKYLKGAEKKGLSEDQITILEGIMPMLKDYQKKRVMKAIGNTIALALQGKLGATENKQNPSNNKSGADGDGDEDGDGDGDGDGDADADANPSALEAVNALQAKLKPSNSAETAAQAGGRLHKTKKKYIKHNARLLSKRKKHTVQKAMQKAKQKARSRKIHRAISRTAKRLFKSQQNFLQLN